MAPVPVVEPLDKAASRAADVTAKPALDDAPEETPGAQAHDSGSATSLSNTSSSTRNLDTVSDAETTDVADAVEEPLDKSASSPPPLPDEPLPEDGASDDGWDPMWSDEHQAWYFYNRLTQQTQWDNPRVPTGGAPAGSAAEAASTGAAAATAVATAVIGGYNPAVHGDYDPTAWYATGGVAPEAEAADIDEDAIAAAAAAAAAVIQRTDPSIFRSSNPDVEFGGGHRYTHEAKTGRQLNAFFDVAANSSEHDGRSLRAERSGKKPTKAELKAFKEKRRAKKEEKRRAWLRD